MDSLQQGKAEVKGAVSSIGPSSPPYPPNTQNVSQAKVSQAKNNQACKLVFKDSKLYRYLLAETRRRDASRVQDIERKLVGMTCDDAYALVHSIKRRKQQRECKRCGREIKEHIEGYCFDCYKEV